MTRRLRRRRKKFKCWYQQIYVVMTMTTNQILMCSKDIEALDVSARTAAHTITLVVIHSDQTVYIVAR
jgi:hypothetical protein